MVFFAVRVAGCYAWLDNGDSEQRNFNSDINLWVDRIIDNRLSAQQLVHPLELPLWRGPRRALYRLLETAVPREKARLIATRFFAALFAGIGVGFLAFLALQNGIRGTQLAILFIVYLLFISSSKLCPPEHFAISSGLLSITFVVPFVVANSKIRAAILDERLKVFPQTPVPSDPALKVL